MADTKMAALKYSASAQSQDSYFQCFGIVDSHTMSDIRALECFNTQDASHAARELLTGRGSLNSIRPGCSMETDFEVREILEGFPFTQPTR